MDFIKDAFENTINFFYKNSAHIVYAFTGVYMAVPEILTYVSASFFMLKKRIGIWDKSMKKNLEKLSHNPR